MQELDQTQELIQMLKERLNEKDETNSKNASGKRS